MQLSVVDFSPGNRYIESVGILKLLKFEYFMKMFKGISKINEEFKF